MRPILFNTEMVKAILDGRKTTTRRVIKPKCKHNFIGTDIRHKPMECSLVDDETQEIICSPQPPFTVNDILYVRETWQKNCCGTGWPWLYKASPEYNEYEPDGWRPSIHMPKEAARIFLHVTAVYAKRLQDMTWKNALEEGIAGEFEHYETFNGGFFESIDEINSQKTMLNFKILWNSTIKKSDIDKYSWAANPWVWVISFERCEKPKEE